jgi:hypothetical protein
MPLKAITQLASISTSTSRKCGTIAANKFSMKTQADNRRDLRQIIIYGSSLALGAAAASLEALRPHYEFVFSTRTGLAFFLGAGVLWGYWQILFHPDNRRHWRLVRGLATAVVGVGGLAAFLYPLRYVAASRYPELATGLFAAVFALSGVAIMLLLCRRLFEGDPENEAGNPGDDAGRHS